MTEAFFAIYALDHPDTLEKRLPLRPHHLARLAALEENKQLALAGPLLDPAGKVSGSLIIARFRDLQTAEAWFAEDPYVLANIYQSVTIRLFNPVLPMPIT